MRVIDNPNFTVQLLLDGSTGLPTFLVQSVIHPNTAGLAYCEVKGPEAVVLLLHLLRSPALLRPTTTLDDGVETIQLADDLNDPCLTLGYYDDPDLAAQGLGRVRSLTAVNPDDHTFISCWTLEYQVFTDSGCQDRLRCVRDFDFYVEDLLARSATEADLESAVSGALASDIMWLSTHCRWASRPLLASNVGTNALNGGVPRRPINKTVLQDAGQMYWLTPVYNDTDPDHPTFGIYDCQGRRMVADVGTVIHTLALSITSLFNGRLDYGAIILQSPSAPSVFYVRDDMNLTTCNGITPSVLSCLVSLADAYSQVVPTGTQCLDARLAALMTSRAVQSSALAAAVAPLATSAQLAAAVQPLLTSQAAKMLVDGHTDNQSAIGLPILQTLLSLYRKKAGKCNYDKLVEGLRKLTVLDQPVPTPGGNIHEMNPSVLAQAINNLNNQGDPNG